MSSCAICNHPRLAEISEKVRSNEMTIDAAAREFGVTYQLTWRHFREHDAVSQRFDLSKIKDIDTLVILRDITNILQERLEELKDLPVSHMNERMLNSNINTLRTTVMDLEKLTGRLRSAPILQLQQINIHYEKIVEFLIQELCPECRRKATQYLEKVMNQW